MYIIIAYDIKVERVNKVKSFLRQHLFWIQNSLFEGEVTISQFENIKKNLKNIINEDEDSIIIFRTRIEELMDKEVLGIEKAPIDEIL